MRTTKFRFMWLIAAAALAFTACDKDDDDNNKPLVEDGFYVSGKAIFTEELNQTSLMEKGWVDKFPNPSELREDLWVKFLYVNASSDGFFLKVQAGPTLKTYGLDGAWTADTVGKKDWAWTGTIKENGNAFTVPSEGLYFFIVDMTTKKTAILKVKSFEVVGNMTNWGYDENYVFTKKSLVLDKGEWEFENLTLKPGKEFKIRFNGIWNYSVDTFRVQTNIGMGEDLTKFQYGGGNYTVTSTGDATHIPAGIYKLNLSWDFSKGVTLSWTKTADVTYTDWSNTQIEVVGDGISSDNPNAITDNIWGWNVYLFADNDGKPTKNGNVYTWKWTNVKILADQGWKVRCHDQSNGFDAGNNIIDPNNAQNWTPGNGNTDIKLNADGNYDLTLVIDAENGDTKKLSIKLHQ